MNEVKPKIKLTGADGNAFNIMGIARQAASKAKWPKDKIEAYLKEAMSGDYNNLLAVTMKHFDVR